MSTMNVRKISISKCNQQQIGPEWARYFTLGSCMRKFDFRKEERDIWIGSASKVYREFVTDHKCGMIVNYVQIRNGASWEREEALGYGRVTVASVSWCSGFHTPIPVSLPLPQCRRTFFSLSSHPPLKWQWDRALTLGHHVERPAMLFKGVTAELNLCHTLE